MFTRKLLLALRAHPALKDAVVWKLNDQFTKGIPDVLIAVDGKTTYFELKCFPNAPTKIQAHWLRKLLPRAYVVTHLSNGEIFFNGEASKPVFTLAETVEEIVERCLCGT